MNAIEEHRLALYEPVEKRGKAMSNCPLPTLPPQAGEGASCTGPRAPLCLTEPWSDRWLVRSARAPALNLTLTLPRIESGAGSLPSRERGSLFALALASSGRTARVGRIGVALVRLPKQTAERRAAAQDRPGARRSRSPTRMASASRCATCGAGSQW